MLELEKARSEQLSCSFETSRVPKPMCPLDACPNNEQKYAHLAFAGRRRSGNLSARDGRGSRNVRARPLHPILGPELSPQSHHVLQSERNRERQSNHGRANARTQTVHAVTSIVTTEAT